MISRWVCQDPHSQRLSWHQEPHPPQPEPCNSITACYLQTPVSCKLTNYIILLSTCWVGLKHPSSGKMPTNSHPGFLKLYLTSGWGNVCTGQLNQVGFGTRYVKGFEKNHLGETEIIHPKAFLFIYFGYIGTRKLFILEGRLEFIWNRSYLFNNPCNEVHLEINIKLGLHIGAHIPFQYFRMLTQCHYCKCHLIGTGLMTWW